MNTSNLEHVFSPHNISSKLRSTLSQFSDVFSEFGKYIAPAYHHDRCERSVHMRLYTMHKREFVMVFVIFFACFGLSVFIGLAGPPITITVSQNASTLVYKPNNSEMATGPFMLPTPAISTYSQQLWVIAEIVVKENADGGRFEKPFQISVSIEAVTEEKKPIMLLVSDGAHNKTRKLSCFWSGKPCFELFEFVCDELIILHLGFLDFSRYIITVRFYGLEQIDANYGIRDVMFFFKSYNSSFTQVEIWFRFIFLVLTFIVTCWFAHTLRKFTLYNWSIEQKWMTVLLPLLLLYNDPVFPLTFLVNSWVPGMLDAMFQATFLCALLLFWLCLYHGIRQNERPLLTFYGPKVLIVGMLWISAFTLASWQEFNELRDPTYNYKVDTGHFTGLKTFFFTIGGLYLAYLLYLIIRAYAELRTMPYFDVRLKFLTLLMLIVISISIAITVLRFGVSVLQDNFIAELSANYSNSVEFMSFYGLLNFYLYTMAYVYAPSKKAIYESHLKDNPTFSMINDSDEEVIYGSDNEATRPLTSNHKAKEDS
ncbi:Transmembrane protein 181 [Nymphon striatum]|nr:Transmembrane protein 181 [Nymphon striatum]